MDYELWANNALVKEDYWTGKNITYNLNALSSGKHSIRFHLYNDSNLLFSDEFSVEIASRNLVYLSIIGGGVIITITTGVTILIIKRRKKKLEN